MITVKKKKRFIKLEEVYYCDDHNKYKTDADIVLFYQSSEPYKNCKHFNTLHIDLTPDEETLFHNIEKSTRQQINRSAKDDVTFKVIDDPSIDEINEFVKFYNIFAESKNLPLTTNERLIHLKEVNAFAITCALDSAGKALCYHTYAYDKIRARILQSASHYNLFEDSGLRSLVGRANRRLHWIDMLEFKKRGITLYDFGGLALPKDDDHLKNVDHLKLGYGGQKVTEYSFYKGTSALGKLIMALTGKKAT